MDWLTHSVSRSIDIRRIVWATHRMEKTQQLSQLCIIQVIADAFGDDRSRGGGFRGVFSVSVRKHRVFHSRTSPSGVAIDFKKHRGLQGFFPVVSTELSTLKPKLSQYKQGPRTYWAC